MQSPAFFVRLLHAARLLAGLAVLASTGCQSCKVTRVNDGRAFCEREIDPAAYAAYARGQLAESSGDLQGALLEYQQVTLLDEQAAQAWARIGAIQCRTGQKAAEPAWSKALAISPTFYVVWFERARCAFERGELTQADALARTALQLGPTRTEVTLLNAHIASRLGDPEREASLLFGALAVEPANAVLWESTMTSPTLPASYREYAARRFLSLRPLGEAWVPPVYRTRQATSATQRQIEAHLRRQLELALSRRDAQAALRTAALLGVQPNELALMALLAGFETLATQQSNLLLALDPNDASAWLIATVAADVSRATEKYEQLLAHAPAQPGRLEPALISAFSDLIRRRARLAQCADPKASDCDRASAEH